MKVVNLLGDEWDGGRDRPGWQWRRLSVGDRLGAHLIGASLYELGPGQKTFPYHFQHGEEEWLLVLGGRPTLRTPAGEREVVRGDLVGFPSGPDGAHQVRNDSDAPVRLLMFSSHSDYEIAEYPDSGKIGVFARDLRKFFRAVEDVDYFEGEE